MVDIVIVGMPRCGSISLHQWLINLNTKSDSKVYRDECIFREDATRYFQSRWPEAKPAIIFRNPIERCWSWYHYIKPDMSYYEFLKARGSNHGFGELNAIKQCNIKKWITPWLPLKPLFFSFESCIKWDDFPKMNESEEKLKMTEAHRNITREFLRKELLK